MVLQSIFDHPAEEAHRLMGAVHGQGRGVAGTYPAEIAAIKVADVLELATEAEYPLLCELEPA
jgi:ATP-dependent Clp protease adaptor protein ClpS